MSVALLTTLTLLLAGGPGPGDPSGPDPTPDRAAAPRDTTVALRSGQSVAVSNLRGRLLVETWERDAVRIEDEDGGRLPLEVESRRDRVELRGASRHGRSPAGTIRLRVPARVALDVRGGRLDTRIEGTRGSLRISSLHGSIELRSLSGDIEARTVHGTIEAVDVSGTIRLRSVDEDVRVRGVEGELNLETVDGDLIVEDAAAAALSATNVDGDVEFHGRLLEGGRYSLTTHDGDLTVALVEPVSARVTVSTFDGEFEADFPVTLERFRGGREMSFTLGDGAAELHLGAFDGDIRLRRSP